MRAASFLLLRCSLLYSLCARVDIGACAADWAFLGGLLWSTDELLLNEAERVWSLVVAFSEVRSLCRLCFCGEVWASVIARAVCTLMWALLFFRGVQSLLPASVWSTEETAVEGLGEFDKSRSLNLGMEGGVGLKPEGERSSVSLVVCRASGEASLLTWLQPKASGQSCGSASLPLLEDLLLWAGWSGVEMKKKKDHVNEQNTTVCTV